MTNASDGKNDPAAGLMAALGHRRSVRKFRDQAVPRELLMRVIEAGVQAPSACNIQGWRFILLNQVPTQNFDPATKIVITLTPQADLPAIAAAPCPIGPFPFSAWQPLPQLPPS